MLIDTVSVDEPTTTLGWKILSEEREKKKGHKKQMKQLISFITRERIERL